MRGKNLIMVGRGGEFKIYNWGIYQRGGGRKFFFFFGGFFLHYDNITKLLTLGNCGISGDSVARATRAAAVGVPAGLQVTREKMMRSSKRRAKTVVGLTNFISSARGEGGGGGRGGGGRYR